mgnify:CR=1 FL=1
MFQRVTVEEFNLAREEFPGEVVTGRWFEPGFCIPGRNQKCVACALTVVGLLRGYFTISELADYYEKNGKSQLALKTWDEKTSEKYVEGFTANFDDTWDDEEESERLFEPGRREEEGDDDLCQGLYDGVLFRYALDAAKLSPGVD